MKTIIIISIFVVCASSLCSQVTNGLIAKYYFNNGNANDDGGKYHGSVNGAVLTADRFGNPNKAFQFGINQNISIKDTNALDGMSNGLAISFWVNAPIVNNYQNFLISKFSHCGGGTDAYNISIHSSNTILSQLDDSLGLDAYQIGTTTITDNKWHHIVVIWEKPNVRIYIDTILEPYSSSDLFNSTISNSPENLTFGNPDYTYCSTLTFDYNEKLDDIRIYNRALTKKEVDTLFNESNPCTPRTTTISKAIQSDSSYYFNGQYLTKEGSYRDTLKTNMGCDSFIVLNLTITCVPKTTTISKNIASSTSFYFNGQYLTKEGTYSDTLKTNKGCDSFIVLILSVTNHIIHSDKSVSVYLNPTIGKIIVDGLTIPQWIAIHSIDGRKLKEIYTQDIIPVDDLASGIYFIKLGKYYHKIRLDK